MSVSDAAVLAAMDTLARHALFLKPEEMRSALEAAEPFLVERERETRENANACTLRVEAERDALRSAHDSLIGELATILGPGKAPSGVGREEWWIGRVGGALAAVEAERDAARADVDTLLEAIAGHAQIAMDTSPLAATMSLHLTASTIAARRKEAS